MHYRQISQDHPTNRQYRAGCVSCCSVLVLVIGSSAFCAMNSKGHVGAWSPVELKVRAYLFSFFLVLTLGASFYAGVRLSDMMSLADQGDDRGEELDYQEIDQPQSGVGNHSV